MSPRKGRDTGFKRHLSKFDREPSPKRLRRDGKQTTERPSRSLILDANDYSDRDQKHRQRLQYALPVDAPDTVLENGKGNAKIDKKTNGHHEGTKNSSDRTEVPRS